VGVKRGSIHVCSFEAVDYRYQGKGASYEAFKAAVLKAGRFSVFEATATQLRAKLFTRLSKDPTVFLDNSCGYPWTRVTKVE